jgi:predicted double-glycine peptidase
MPLPAEGSGLFVRFTALLCLICASGAVAQQPGPVRSLLEIRRANVIVQQWDISCGAAALATVLTYQHGDRVTEKAVAEGMLRRTDPLRVRVRGGFSLLDLKRYVETRGYTGIGYSTLTIDDLEEFGPTLVPLNLKGYSHFVVFKGVLDGRVLVADPAFGNRALSLDRFDDAWVEKIGFVVRRKDGTVPQRNMLVPKRNEAAGPPDIVVRSAVR